MKTDFRLVILALLAWAGLEARAPGSDIAPSAPLEKTPPTNTVPDEAHPSFGHLIGEPEERTRQRSEEAEHWYKLGLAYVKASQTQLAVMAFQKAVALDPDYVPGLENLGINLYYDHQPEKALAAFNKAVERGSSDPEVWNDMGMILLDLNRLEECEDALEQGFKLTSQSRRLWNTLGLLRQKQGRNQDALEAFQHAVQIDPNDAGVRNNLAIAQSKIGSTDVIVSHPNAVRPDPKLIASLSSQVGTYIAQKNFAAASGPAQHWVDLAPDDPDAWRSLAQCATYHQDWAQAVECYHRSIDILGLGNSLTDKHGLALAYAQYGNGCSNIGHYADAEKLLQEAVTIDPASTEAWDDLGCLRMSQGRSQDALSAVQKSLALDPNQAKALVTLGSIYRYDLHQPAEAGKAYQKLEAIQHGSSCSAGELSAGWGCVAEALLAQAHDKGAPGYEAALDALKHATALDPANSSYWYETALCERTLGNQKAVDLALSKWRTSGSLIPQFPGIDDIAPAAPSSPAPSGDAASRAALAEANDIKTMVLNHQFDDAVSEAQKNTQTRPDDPLGWYELGDVFMNMKRYEEAISCLTKATALDPKMGPAWFDLGNSLAYRGKFDDAIAALIQSIDNMPGYPTTWQVLDECYLAKKDLAGGEVKVRELLQSHPDCGYAWCALGDIESFGGNPDASLEPLQKAVALQPNYAHAWNSLGLTYLKLHLDKALESFHRATEEDPTDPEAWNNLGFTSYTVGKTTEAIDAYKHALQFSPHHVLALYNLVVAYAAQQQWDLARQTCDVLAEVNPAQAAQLRQRFPNVGVASAPAAKSASP